MGAVLCSLLGFPCLRVGALLACGVYGASLLWGLLSRLPLVVTPPAATVCWALVGVYCAVLSPWALARPTLLGLRLWIPMVLWSKLLVFSWPLYYGSFPSLPLVMDVSGWLLPALRAGSPTPGWRRVLGMR